MPDAEGQSFPSRHRSPLGARKRRLLFREFPWCLRGRWRSRRCEEVFTRKHRRVAGDLGRVKCFSRVAEDKEQIRKCGPLSGQSDLSFRLLPLACLCFFGKELTCPEHLGSNNVSTNNLEIEECLHSSIRVSYTAASGKRGHAHIDVVLER